METLQRLTSHPITLTRSQIIHTSSMSTEKHSKYSQKRGLATPIHINRKKVVDAIHINHGLRMLECLLLPTCGLILRILTAIGPQSVENIEIYVSWHADKKQSQGWVSRHLSILRRHRLVSYYQRGKNHIYEVDTSRIEYINAVLARFLRPGTTEDVSGKSAGIV